MRIGVLGPLEVTHQGHPVEIGGARLRALLVRLAVDAGRTVPVDSLVEELWPRESPGLNTLQSLVSRLRRSVPDPAAVQSVPGGYRLAVEPDDVDAHRFERLARQGALALARGDHQGAATTLAEALGLWRGPPLPELAGSPKAEGIALRLQVLRLQAVEDRLEAELGLGHHAAVAAELEPLTAANPLRERLRALQMRALYGTGRQAEALAVFDDVRHQLADELGVDPSPQLAETHLAVLRADPALGNGHASARPAAPDAGGPTGAAGPAPGPAPGRPSARWTNLRAALTSFVGRDVELAEVTDLLGHGRLVTLVGPGGSGKTRLATEVAARASDGSAHGVWLVELAAITDPNDLAPATLGAIGLHETRLLETTQQIRPRDAGTRLVETLAGAETVVVLDNCEHLLDAVAALADHLLGRCPGLRILATSREPLGITGEVVRAVRPLGSPPAGSRPAQALAYPALELLVDRAKAVRGDFRLDGRTVAAAIEICRRLDGLPLAIELAAARLRTLPIETVAARLDDRFRLLTGGSRTALPRHQTLRAVVAWSWELLEPEERLAIERFAVFPGGLTVAGAEAVCGAQDLAGRDALDVVSALVDKSLLHAVEDSPDGLTRYRALETIREYGIERLAERGELGEVRQTHARYVLNLAEAAEPRLRGPSQVTWIGRLRAERDNLLAALRFAADVGDADVAIRLGAALAWFWTLMGNHVETANWLSLAYSVPGPAPRAERLLVHALSVVNQAVGGDEPNVMGRGAEIMAELRRELEGVDVRSGHPLLMWIEPGLALLSDDLDQVEELVSRQLDHPDPWARAGLLLMRGQVFENAGDVAVMRDSYERALELFRAVGDRWGTSATLTSLAGLWLMEGDPDAAINAYEEARRLGAELAMRDDTTVIGVMTAGARYARGERELAGKELRTALEQAERNGSLIGQAMALFGLAEAARGDGDLDRAEEFLARARTAWAERGSAGPPQLMAVVHASIGMLALDRDDLDSAVTALLTGSTLAVATKDGPVAARVAVAVAELNRRRGSPEQAARLLGAAVRLRGTFDRSNPDEASISGKVRDALGDKAFEAAFGSGRGLDRVAALALLPTDPDPPQHG